MSHPYEVTGTFPPSSVYFAGNDVMSTEFETVAELSRYMAYMFKDLKDDIGSMATKLDNVVGREQHKEDMASIRAEIKELEASVESYKNKQAALWKWLIGSLAIPAAAVIISILAIITP